MKDKGIKAKAVRADQTRTNENEHSDPTKDKGIKTKAVRAGQTRTEENEHSDPIFVTSSFVFDSAENASSLFSEKISGNIYSRFTNPTTRAFQNRLAALEKASHCVATASGMSAILAICLSILKSGDRIVATRGLFGSTINLFNNILTRFNIETTYLPPRDTERFADMIRNGVKMVFVETPSNPLCELVNISELANLTSSRDDCYLVVDNCLCTPILQQPLVKGADVVVHSSTKFIDGQGRGLGGAIVTNDSKVSDAVFGFLRTAGPTMSPFNAWMFHKGLETLPIRMKESCSSANAIARSLDLHPNVTRVYYPGLEHHPDHELAGEQQSDYGALMSFEVAGGRASAWKLIDSLTIFSITANFGDAKSTVTHPATTTHSRISAEDRERMGVTEGLIRLCIGLEDKDDLIEDLSEGLDKSQEE